MSDISTSYKEYLGSGGGALEVEEMATLSGFHKQLKKILLNRDITCLMLPMLKYIADENEIDFKLVRSSLNGIQGIRLKLIGDQGYPLEAWGRSFYAPDLKKLVPPVTIYKILYQFAERMGPNALSFITPFKEFLPITRS